MIVDIPLFLKIDRFLLYKHNTLSNFKNPFVTITCVSELILRLDKNKKSAFYELMTATQTAKNQADV